ncbi:MAG TPA: ABC transporter permease subunit [Candidatus Krumholzibacterium sp.]|nr:ABC transporter permease subunit [Candidatus Krumholzibacterium sp.]
MGYLLAFFLRDGIHSRRTLWIAIMGLIPVACAVLLLAADTVFQTENLRLSTIYPQLSYLLFLHFLLPLTSIFIGTAIIGDEVEEKTLPYLITRPVPRWGIVAMKTLAGVITIGAVILVSFTLTWLIMNAGSGMGRLIRSAPAFIRSGSALLLGTLVYVPLFGVVGALLKRPVLAGLLFAFGWESSVAFFPGNVRLLTVAHYLHSLFPPIRKISTSDIGGSLFGIAMTANRTPVILSVLGLFGMIVLFSGILTAILYFKEYRLDER